MIFSTLYYNFNVTLNLLKTKILRWPDWYVTTNISSFKSTYLGSSNLFYFMTKERLSTLMPLSTSLILISH